MMKKHRWEGVSRGRGQPSSAAVQKEEEVERSTVQASESADVTGDEGRQAEAIVSSPE